MLVYILAFFLVSTSVFSSNKKILSDCKELKTYFPELNKAMQGQLCNTFDSLFISYDKNKIEILSDALHLKDNILGVRLAKDKVIKHHYYKKNFKSVYKTHYTLDKFGKRETPHQSKLNSQRNSFAILFGGSFTFGSGVKDNETIAAYINNLQQEYQAYNFGIAGTAIHHSIDIINKTNISEQISQKKGVGIYVFIDAHIDRVAGRGFWSTFQTGLPYYYLDGEEVIREKSFTKGNYLFNFIQSLLYRMFKSNFSIFTIKKDIKLMCKLVLKAKNDFQKIFNDSKFYFLFHNFNSIENKTFIQKKLKICLVKNKIDVLQFIKPKTFRQNDWYFQDQPPKARTNLYIAKFLASLLNG
jgi:hypothetical protein